MVKGKYKKVCFNMFDGKIIDCHSQKNIDEHSKQNKKLY